MGAFIRCFLLFCRRVDIYALSMSDSTCAVANRFSICMMLRTILLDVELCIGGVKLSIGSVDVEVRVRNVKFFINLKLSIGVGVEIEVEGVNSRPDFFFCSRTSGL